MSRPGVYSEIADKMRRAVAEQHRLCSFTHEQEDAWRALIAFPVHTAEEAAEKLAISRELATDDASADTLLDGITAA